MKDVAGSLGAQGTGPGVGVTQGAPPLSPLLGRRSPTVNLHVRFKGTGEAVSFPFLSVGQTGGQLSCIQLRKLHCSVRGEKHLVKG